MVRCYLLPILFLYCTSILVTFVVSDKPPKKDPDDVPGKGRPYRGNPPPTLSYTPPPLQQGSEPSTQQELMVHFYAKTCPNAETLVMAEMKLIQAEDPTLMPALVRLHFHDCFVRVSKVFVYFD